MTDDELVAVYGYTSREDPWTLAQVNKLLGGQLPEAEAKKEKERLSEFIDNLTSGLKKCPVYEWKVKRGVDNCSKKNPISVYPSAEDVV